MAGSAKTTMDRRHALATLGGGLALGAGIAFGGAPLRAAIAGQSDTASSGRRYLSALGRPGGGYALAGFDQAGALWLELPLPGRGHDIALDPSGRWAVQLARRPGTFGLAIDLTAEDPAAEPLRVDARPGRHYYGHGVFSPDGALFYTVENDYDGGRGAIGVRDATDGFRPLGELPAQGIGPHDISLLSDGETFAVAIGGIQTHPDRGREKLNLDSMAPSLAYVSRHDGRLLDRAALDPAYHRVSLRHLSVSDDNQVAIAGQFEGPDEARVPLLALHRPGGGAATVLHGPEAVEQRTRNYCGHIALDDSGDFIAVSHPHGGLVTLWSRAEARYLHDLSVPDGCGLAPAGGRGRFLVSSGSGALLIHDAASEETARLDGDASEDAMWDNHLMALA